MTRATVTHGSYSDIGLVRPENQDAWGAFPEESEGIGSDGSRLYIVADGMGGYRGGARASRIAVSVARDVYFDLAVHQPAGEALRTALQKANEAIYRQSLEDPSVAHMGSTCTALALRDGRVWIAHIGDSRAYRITRASIDQLTDDHSRVGELQRSGLLTKESAKKHADRSLLTRALGAEPGAEIDLLNGIPLEPGARFLLCTDGLTNNVEDEELQRIALSRPPGEACRELVALANARGGQDNATALLVHVREGILQQ